MPAARSLRHLTLAAGVAVGGHLGLLGWLVPQPVARQVRPAERPPALRATAKAAPAWQVAVRPEAFPGPAIPVAGGPKRLPAATPSPARRRPEAAVPLLRRARGSWRRDGGDPFAAAAAASAASAAAPRTSPVPASASPLAWKPPPAQRLRFAARRGDQHGRAELRWERPASGGYALLLVLRYDGQARDALIQSSRGAIGEAGLQPRRYAARRADAGLRTASFDDADEAQALPPGTQDRLSWMAQLAAVAAAWETRPAVGARIVLPVAGMRGERDDWIFEVLAPEPGAPGDAGHLHLSRAPLHRYDHRIDIWLSAQAPGWPQRISWTHPARAALIFERLAPADDGPPDDTSEAPTPARAGADAMQQR